jgi:hypothetical protein
MGLFWNLLQQSQIHDQKEVAGDLQTRVAYLEQQLNNNNKIINSLISLLEEKFGQDIDGDGKIG